MAIYRPPKSRWPLAAATLVAGLALGFALGLALGGDDFDAGSAGEEIQTRLTAAAGSLEVVGIEYAEAVEDGEVVAEPEYQGARDALDSSRSAYAEVEPAVDAIASDRADEIASAYDQVEDLMDDVADEDEVEAALGDLESLLTGS